MPITPNDYDKPTPDDKYEIGVDEETGRTDSKYLYAGYRIILHFKIFKFEFIVKRWEKW